MSDILNEPPRGGVLLNIAGEQVAAVLTLGGMERLETKHNCSLYAMATSDQPRYAVCRDALTLGLVNGGKDDKSALAILEQTHKREGAMGVILAGVAVIHAALMPDEPLTKLIEELPDEGGDDGKKTEAGKA